MHPVVFNKRKQAETKETRKGHFQVGLLISSGSSNVIILIILYACTFHNFIINIPLHFLNAYLPLWSKLDLQELEFNQVSLSSKGYLVIL